ncbi:MAG: response regulator transcription factor [Acidobacteria bacterium]|nr:response regulator transcription factor [Acidobacteriota bacterium]
MRILLVEDDPKQASVICNGLRHAGYVVDLAEDGQSGLDLALGHPYDLIVMDVMLPKLNGFEVIEALRSAGMRSRILVLSALQSVDDRVTGLLKGGDDYLVKPFAFAELLARIQALLRRTDGSEQMTVLRVGDLELDLMNREARRFGEVIPLQTKEFELLEYLMRNKGQIVSRKMIMEYVWNFHFDPQTNVVEVRISKLREKVERPGYPPLIHTVRGAGYVVRDP